MYPGTHVATQPDKPAIIMADTGRSLTYAELEDHSVRLARVFAEAGLRRGDHVAILSDNSPEVYEFYWAGLRSGLYVTAVNNHLSAAETAYIVDDCGARVLVVAASLGELAEQIVEQTPKVELRLAFGGDVPGYGSYEDALAGVSGEVPADQPRGTDMLYSSGTTGRPKGIKGVLPDRQVGEPGDVMTTVFGKLFGFGPDTVYYSPAPTYHAAPLRFGGMINALGGTLVLTKRFDAEQSLKIIQEHGVTHSQWVPTMFVRMLKLEDDVRLRYTHDTLKIAIHAAAPCPVEVKQKMLDWWGPVLHEYYGSTEGNGLTIIGPDDWAKKPGSVGRGALGVIHVCDAESGEELPVGEDGVVYFEREEQPFEYHNDPEKTREAQHPDHPLWSTTGDIGHLDTDGYLFLTDRKAFMIISGGVNIYPQEVEDCLTLHPKVLDVAVIGIPDPEMGEQVKAVVEPAPGTEPSPELAAELLDFVRARIARYKAPRSIDFVDKLPRSQTGKLVKHVLKKRYTEEAVS